MCQVYLPGTVQRVGGAALKGVVAEVQRCGRVDEGGCFDPCVVGEDQQRADVESAVAAGGIQVQLGFAIGELYRAIDGCALVLEAAAVAGKVAAQPQRNVPVERFADVHAETVQAYNGLNAVSLRFQQGRRFSLASTTGSTVIVLRNRAYR